MHVQPTILGVEHSTKRILLRKVPTALFLVSNARCFCSARFPPGGGGGVPRESRGRLRGAAAAPGGAGQRLRAARQARLPRPVHQVRGGEAPRTAWNFRTGATASLIHDGDLLRLRNSQYWILYL